MVHLQSALMCHNSAGDLCNIRNLKICPKNMLMYSFSSSKKLTLSDIYTHSDKYVILY